MNYFFRMALFSSAAFWMALNASAESKCTASVSYVLEKESQNTEVYFGEVKASAADQALAKSAIESEAAKIKGKAMQQCRKLHENVSGCLQAKLEAASQALQAASFAARKALEDSLIDDCKSQKANCKEIKVGEPKCEDLAAPAAEEAPKDAKGAAADKKAKK